jgi:oxalate decarboxylase/phosphoglucose isomerase-like protein (cupin superfamily)
MQQVGRGRIIYDSDVETLVFDWGALKFLSEPAVTLAQHQSFGLVALAPGKGHERHNHPGAEEIIFVLSGEGEQMIDDQPPVPIRAGTCIYIPPDIYHSTLNTGWEPLRFVLVFAPPGPERVLREIPGCRVLSPGQVPS